MSILEKIPNYSKNMPHKPIFDIDFQDEVHMAWGEKWGYNSTFGNIKKVLVYRPGDEQTDARALWYSVEVSPVHEGDYYRTRRCNHLPLSSSL